MKKIIQTEEFKCRLCKCSTFELLDFGNLPIPNKYILNETEDIPTQPFIIRICNECGTSQVQNQFPKEKMFLDYGYQTPKSALLTAHYNWVIEFLINKNFINETSKILEIGSNNGHFLNHLSKNAGLVVGIDPSIKMEREKKDSVFTEMQFFGHESEDLLLNKYGEFDLVVARHSLAHTSNLLEILDSISLVLKNGGKLIIENAYWPDTICNANYDQFYHEHIFYHSVRSMLCAIKDKDLYLVDYHKLNVQGGSMLYIIEKDVGSVLTSVEVPQNETSLHLQSYYNTFLESVIDHKEKLKSLLNELLRKNKKIHAYGASAKSVVLFNQLNLDYQTIPVILDSTLEKVGKLLPQSFIRIVEEDYAIENPADYYLITAWNYLPEIIEKLKKFKLGKSKLIVPFPEIKIIKLDEYN